MRRFKKIMAAVLTGALIVGSVGVMPVKAIEDETTSDECTFIYQEDFNGDEQLVCNGANGYTSESGYTKANLAATGEIYDGTYGTDTYPVGTYPAGVGNPYGKTEDGALYLRGSGINSGRTGTAKVNNQLWFSFTNDKEYSNGTVYIQANVKTYTDVIPYQFLIVGGGKTLVTMTGGKIDGGGSTVVNSTDYTTFHIEINFVNGAGTYSVYLNDNTTLVKNASYGGGNVLKSLAFRVTGHHNDLESEADGGNAGICIDNIAVYESDTRYNDVFAEPTAITLDASSISSMEIGATQQLTATVETEGIVPEITWTSDDKSVAIVSDDGLVTAVGEGRTTITAKAGNATATCTVTVGTVVIYRQDFEEVSSYTELSEAGYSCGGLEGYTPTIDDADGNQSLQLNHGVTAENYVTIPLEKVPTDTTVWVTMDIYTTADLKPKRLRILADDNATDLDTLNNTRILFFVNSVIRNHYDTSARFGNLTTDSWTTLSFKIDFANDMIYTYVDGTKLEMDRKYSDKMESLKYLRIAIPYSEDDSGQSTDMNYKIDNLAVYESEEPVDLFVKPTAITIDKEKLKLKVGGTETLTATVEPTGIDAEVTWTSDNESVAMVSSDGLVTGKRVGKAVVTAQAGDVTVTCTVTVGISDLIYQQDFESIETYDELEYSSGGATDYTAKLVEEYTNQYLLLENDITEEAAGNFVQIAIPEKTEYADSLWIEMDVFAPEDLTPKKFNIKVNDSSSMGSSASPITIASMNTSMRNPSNNSNLYSLKQGEWNRLSYKIDLVNSKVTGYWNGQDDNTKYEYTYSTTKTKITYLRITIPYDDSNAEGKGFKIDNLAVYTNDERVDLFAPEIKGANLSLSGNIGVNFHADLGGYVGRECAYMKLTLPNKTQDEVQIKFSDVNKDETTGYYVFTGDVSAKDMTGDIKVEMYAGDRQLIESVNYTVCDNAQYIIDNSVDTAANYSEEYANAAPLVKALLNYGAYAQTYFEVRNDSDTLANKSLEDSEKDVSSVTAQEISGAIEIGAVRGTSDEVSVYGVSLDLKSQTALNYYFELADNVDISSFTFMVGEEAITPEKSGSMYLIKKSDISALDLKTVYEVNVMKADAEVLNVSYSALQYAYNVLSASEGTDLTGKGKMSELQNVVKALYKYHVAAETYQNSQSVSN